MFDNLNQQQNQQTKTPASTLNAYSSQPYEPNKTEDIFDKTDKVENVWQRSNLDKEKNNNIQNQNKNNNQNKLLIFIVTIAIISVISLIAWLIVNKFLDKNTSSINTTNQNESKLNLEVNKLLDLNNSAQTEQATQTPQIQQLMGPAQPTKTVKPTQPIEPTNNIQNQETILNTADTDVDGLTDDEEKILGTDIYSVDTDNDGLSDREEVKVYKTNPLDFDTDKDGYLDGDEIKKGYDPKGAGKLYEVK